MHFMQGNTATQDANAPKFGPPRSKYFEKFGPMGTYFTEIRGPPVHFWTPFKYVLGYGVHILQCKICSSCNSEKIYNNYAT